MIEHWPLYADFSLKLLAALFLSGLIGLEREFHGRAAGLRTHILVCLASTAIIAVSQIGQDLFLAQGAESVFRIDPWRIAAGIVTGIGFLGGGTILRSEDLIRGLTTAACIWFVAAIGIVIGMGFFIPATIITIVGLFTLICLDPLRKIVPSEKLGKIKIVSEIDSAETVEFRCRAILKNYSISIYNTTISANAETGERITVLYIQSRGIKNKHEILKQIFNLPNIKSLKW